MYNICLIGIVTLNTSLYNEYIIIKIYLKMITHDQHNEKDKTINQN
jgi:hypothetical protein